MLEGENPALMEYRWSGFPEIGKARELPPCLDGESVLRWHHWKIGRSQDRRDYGDYLQKRAMECLSEKTRKWQEEEGKPLRRGWFIGSGDFRERLEQMASMVVGKWKRKSFHGEVLNAHDEGEARRLLERAVNCLGIELKAVEAMRKSDVRKRALAWLLKSNTVVADEWVGQNPGMGDRRNISRAVGRFRRRKEKPVVELIKKLALTVLMRKLILLANRLLKNPNFSLAS